MAELLAEAHLQSNGFIDAYVTRAGADEGLDVVGTGVAAQVKYQAQPVGRPAVQNLIGAAVNYPGARAVFYASSGYTASAVQYADAAGVALFRYDEMNNVSAVNDAAEMLAARSPVGLDPEAFLRDAALVLEGVSAVKERVASISRVATSMARELFDEHRELADSGRRRSARFRALQAFKDQWPTYQRRGSSLGIVFGAELAQDLPQAFREITAANAKLDELEEDLAAVFRPFGDFSRRLREDLMPT